MVTGGTSGIGAGVSHVLSDCGYHIIAATVSEEEIRNFPDRENLETRLLDVTDGDAVLGFFNDLPALYGLVNCAGILRRGDEYDIDVFQEVIDVNLVGTMRCCLAAQVNSSIGPYGLAGTLAPWCWPAA